jgi:prolipoprotein diacylglyceryltransferase
MTIGAPWIVLGVVRIWIDYMRQEKDSVKCLETTVILLLSVIIIALAALLLQLGKDK